MAKAAKIGGAVLGALVGILALGVAYREIAVAAPGPTPRAVPFIRGTLAAFEPASAQVFVAEAVTGRGEFLTITETVESTTTVEVYEWTVHARHMPASFRTGVWQSDEEGTQTVWLRYPEFLERARGVLGEVQIDGGAISWVVRDAASGQLTRRHILKAAVETQADYQARRPRFLGFKPTPWWLRWRQSTWIHREPVSRSTQAVPSSR